MATGECTSVEASMFGLPCGRHLQGHRLLFEGLENKKYVKKKHMIHHDTIMTNYLPAPLVLRTINCKLENLNLAKKSPSISVHVPRWSQIHRIPHSLKATSPSNIAKKKHTFISWFSHLSIPKTVPLFNWTPKKNISPDLPISCVKNVCPKFTRKMYKQ